MGKLLRGVRSALPVLGWFMVALAISGGVMLFVSLSWSTVTHLLASSDPDEESAYLDIVVNDTQLVKCKKIELENWPCAYISQCEDRIDRCVESFEVIHPEANVGALKGAGY